MENNSNSLGMKRTFEVVKALAFDINNYLDSLPIEGLPQILEFLVILNITPYSILKRKFEALLLEQNDDFGDMCRNIQSKSDIFEKIWFWRELIKSRILLNYSAKSCAYSFMSFNLGIQIVFSKLKVSKIFILRLIRKGVFNHVFSNNLLTAENIALFERVLSQKISVGGNQLFFTKKDSSKVTKPRIQFNICIDNNDSFQNSNKSSLVKSPSSREIELPEEVETNLESQIANPTSENKAESLSLCGKEIFNLDIAAKIIPEICQESKASKVEFNEPLINFEFEALNDQSTEPMPLHEEIKADLYLEELGESKLYDLVSSFKIRKILKSSIKMKFGDFTHLTHNIFSEVVNHDLFLLTSLRLMYSHKFLQYTQNGSETDLFSTCYYLSFSQDSVSSYYLKGHLELIWTEDEDAIIIAQASKDEPKFQGRSKAEVQNRQRFLMLM